MNRSLNKILIIGNLGRDPETRYSQSGMPVTSFSVATDRSWIDSSGEEHSETEWFNVICWNSLADSCKASLYKGSRVFIEGRLQTRHWKDSDDTKHSSIEIVANEIVTLEEQKHHSNYIKENVY